MRVYAGGVDIEALVDAWEKWERHPASPETANKLTDLIVPAAASLGVTHMFLHDTIVEHLRATDPRSVDTAVRRACNVG